MRDSIQHRRRFLKTAAVGSIAALAGCSGGGGGGDESGGGDDSGGDESGGSDGGTDTGGVQGEMQSEVNLLWLHDREAGLETINKLQVEFNKQHDNITIENKLIPSSSGQAQEIQRRRAAGNPPNILWYTFGQAYRFAREGNLAPITDIVEKHDLKTYTDREEKFFATSIVGPITHHYRSDLYDSPETFADFYEQAQRIDQETDVTPMQFPNGSGTLPMAMHTSLLWGGDVNIFSGPSDDIELAMASGKDREKAIETYEWLQDAYEYATNGNGLGWGDAANAYAQGSVGTVPYISQWIPTLYLADKPELKENTAHDFHPVTKGVDNDEIFAWFEGNMIWDTNEAENEAARTFLDWFHSTEQFKRFISSNAGDYIPPTKSDMNADWYRSNDAVHQGMMDMFAENADNFKPPVASGSNNALNYPATAGALVMGNAAAQLLHGGKSPSGTIDWIEKEFQATLEETDY